MFGWSERLWLNRTWHDNWTRVPSRWHARQHWIQLCRRLGDKQELEFHGQWQRIWCVLEHKQHWSAQNNICQSVGHTDPKCRQIYCFHWSDLSDLSLCKNWEVPKTKTKRWVNEITQVNDEQLLGSRTSYVSHFRVGKKGARSSTRTLDCSNGFGVPRVNTYDGIIEHNYLLLSRTLFLQPNTPLRRFTIARVCVDTIRFQVAEPFFPHHCYLAWKVPFGVDLNCKYVCRRRKTSLFCMALTLCCWEKVLTLRQAWLGPARGFCRSETLLNRAQQVNSNKAKYSLGFWTLLTGRAEMLLFNRICEFVWKVVRFRSCLVCFSFFHDVW